jgi:hypothetical protein
MNAAPGRNATVDGPRVKRKGLAVADSNAPGLLQDDAVARDPRSRNIRVERVETEEFHGWMVEWASATPTGVDSDAGPALS